MVGDCRVIEKARNSRGISAEEGAGQYVRLVTDKEGLSDGCERRILMERGYFTVMRTLGRIRV